MTGDPSDAELLRRHVEGDPDSFGQLFLRHRDRLWAVALRTLGDQEEAADALQEAMISAFRRAAAFRGESAVTTWLHRIVVNASLDRLRRKATRPVAATGDERTLDLLSQEASHAADPAAASDTALDVAAALRLIPPEQQAALVLVDMLGYPVADAAEVLGISVGTVKSRCARGRARLLPHLSHLRAGGTGLGGRSASPEAVLSRGDTPRTPDGPGPPSPSTPRGTGLGGQPPNTPRGAGPGGQRFAPPNTPRPDRNRAASGSVSPGEE